MIVPFPADDRESAGVNQAHCNDRWPARDYPSEHRWAEIGYGDAASYVRSGYATHMCQRCLVCGRDTEVRISARLEELKRKETNR